MQWSGAVTAKRGRATPQNNRFYRVFEELAAAGVRAEPAVYDEAFADEVRDQLLTVDGVLVWVDRVCRRPTQLSLQNTSGTPSEPRRL